MAVDGFILEQVLLVLSPHQDLCPFAILNSTSHVSLVQTIWIDDSLPEIIVRKIAIQTQACLSDTELEFVTQTSVSSC